MLVSRVILNTQLLHLLVCWHNMELVSISAVLHIRHVLLHQQCEGQN